MSFALPDWPVPGSSAAVVFFSSAQALARIWKARKASNPYILAMIAQAEAETSLDPNGKGDWVLDGKPLTWMKIYPAGAKPTSFGLYQWKDDRLAAIKKATGLDIKASVLLDQATIADAVDAAAWELGSGGPLASAGIAIAAQHSAYMASYEAAVLFEKTGAPDAAERRAKQAERWSVWFQNNGGL